MTPDPVMTSSVTSRIPVPGPGWGLRVPSGTISDVINQSLRDGGGPGADGYYIWTHCAAVQAADYANSGGKIKC